MKSEQIETTKNNILNLLREKRLAEAFSSLKTLVEETSDWHISEKLSELEQSYRYMIHYVAEGIDDPKRDDIYENIIAETIKLCETATNELIARTSTKLYYATLRTERMHPENTEAILARRKRALDKIAVFDELPDSDKDEATEQALLHDKENINFALFRRLWTAFPISSDDFKAVKELFSETSCDTEAQEIAVNAIMLNLLEHYNETLLLLLLDIYADEKIDSFPSSAVKICIPFRKPAHGNRHCHYFLAIYSQSRHRTHQPESERRIGAATHETETGNTAKNASHGFRRRHGKKSGLARNARQIGNYRKNARTQPNAD